MIRQKAMTDADDCQWFQNEANDYYRASRYHRRRGNKRMAVHYANMAYNNHRIAMGLLMRIIHGVDVCL